MRLHCEYSIIAWYGPLDVSHSSQRYLGTEKTGLFLEPVAGFTEERAADHCLNGHLLMFQLLRILVPYRLPHMMAKGSLA